MKVTMRKEPCQIYLRSGTLNGEKAREHIRRQSARWDQVRAALNSGKLRYDWDQQRYIPHG